MTMPNDGIQADAWCQYPGCADHGTPAVEEAMGTSRPANLRRTGDSITDANALEQIAEILRDPEWGVGMLEDIAGLVAKTGRLIEDYPDSRPTWERH
jgi:hypothetical protein